MKTEKREKAKVYKKRTPISNNSKMVTAVKWKTQKREHKDGTENRLQAIICQSQLLW